MKNRIIKIISFIIAIIGLTGLITAPAFADCTNICDCAGVSEEIRIASGCTGAGDNFADVVINIINGILGLLAVVAVVVIVIGGVQYMTSTGDPGKVKKAKDTILYACIGLIIAALAAIIVNFVVNLVNSNSNSDEPTTAQTQENP